MTGKDLFEGMGKIEDELVEEASVCKRKKKNIFLYKMVAAAAVVCLVIGAVAVPQVLDRAEKKRAEKNRVELEEKMAMVGIAGEKKLGDLYYTENSYEAVYDNLKRLQPKESAYDLLGEFTSGSAKMVEDAEMSADSAPNAAADTAKSEEAPANGGTSGEDYSQTNVMTEGVDESDIIKTDGKYLYRVKSGRIEIFDLRDGVPEEVSTVKPEFAQPSDQIIELYVDGDRMLVITSSFDTREDSGFFEKQPMEVSETIVYCFDIKNPRKPKEAGVMRQDGSYYTSRKVGDQVYLFTSFNLYLPDMARRNAVMPEWLDKWIPFVNEKPVAPDCLFLKEQAYGGTLISSFDMYEPDKTIDAKYVSSNGGDVYVSTRGIYLYEASYTSDREITKLSKFVFEDGEIMATDSTSLSGYVRDDFAINEYDGYLRVITTQWYAGADVNMLYVLDEELKETGRIEEIARGEQIYSARFMGDMAYFVTFRNTDPLFTADLSEPDNPRIVGELKVTGFSEYLHFWGKDRLVGIGRNGDEEGLTEGIKLSMFNIEDPADVYEENKVVLPDRDDSGALYGQYKSVIISKDKNLIGFSSESYAFDPEFESGAENLYHVYSYDPEKGFTVKINQEIDYTGSWSCRGLYVGDYFYVVGPDSIDTYKMSEDFVLVE